MTAHKSIEGSDQSLAIQRSATISEFSKRVRCSLASSYVERDAIFKLRYRSYMRAGLISQNSFGRYVEAHDHAPNSYLIGLYVDRKLVSSLRVQIGTQTTLVFPSLELFPDVLGPLLRNKATVIDMSCVATDAVLARPYALLPHVILRTWILAAEHFGADYIAAAARPQHQLFFKRALNCEMHSEMRRSPHHPESVGLLTLNFGISAKRLYQTFPFLGSTSNERHGLFERETLPSRPAGLHPLVL
jgi:hypothetical protein